MSDKLPPILDATCGGRTMWFDKKNPLALFVDRRVMEPRIVGNGRNARIRKVKPDLIADFTALPFPDNSFYLVVFDPPHLVRAGDKAYMTVMYGRLDENWKTTLHTGFGECMRVLRPGGTLIFKWNETQVPVSDVINAVGWAPLFGHRSGKASRTHWMAFMKVPYDR
jgi:SAM-dependent methyltransferase